MPECILVIDPRTIVNQRGVIVGPWRMGEVDRGLLAPWLARGPVRKGE